MFGALRAVDELKILIPRHVTRVLTHVCVSGGAFGRVLEERPNSGPVEVAQQLDASRVEVAVRRNSAEEIGIGRSVGQHRVGVCVR